jgi:hypothetical protein
MQGMILKPPLQHMVIHAFLQHKAMQNIQINYSKIISLIGYEAWALGFLNLKPGPSLLKAQAKPCLRPDLRGPSRAGLRALSLAQHITTCHPHPVRRDM